MNKTKDQLREEFDEMLCLECIEPASPDQIWNWIEERWTPKNEDPLIFISGGK